MVDLLIGELAFLGKGVKTMQQLPVFGADFLVAAMVFALANSSDAFLILRAREMGLSLAMIPLAWAASSASPTRVNVVCAWSSGSGSFFSLLASEPPGM